MQVPSEARIAELLAPYVTGLTLPANIYGHIAEYLNLLLRWNARTNLTAVRDAEDLVTRQVGESLFAARLVPPNCRLLDFGSGAGFPGLPLQMASPGLCVTLAESQGKKASFLREAVRTLRLSCTVWAGRVEDMTADAVFDVVTLRAVDQSDRMLKIAVEHVAPGGRLLLYAPEHWHQDVKGWRLVDVTSIPSSSGHIVRLER